MKENAQEILVVGLPETGKTSFIQALDEVLKHAASEDELQIDGLADDRTYLQSGKKNFLAGAPPGRTDRQTSDTSAELWFRHLSSGRRGRLYLPDKKGETFRDQWVNRQWEKDYRESLQTMSGMLVFVRANEKPRNDERLGFLAQQVTPPGIERPFEMREASAQVQLVDVIQFIAERSELQKPLRVAVIISAWDTVGGEGDLRPRNPTKFLEKEWALVAQYLRSNSEVFTWKVYGVSAYGGTPGKLGALFDVAPHERAQLIDGDDLSHDLTRPIRWLLQLEEPSRL